MVFACEEYDSKRPELSDGDADGTLSSQEQDEGNLSGAGTDTQPEKESRAEELIDINAAGAEELMTLNGDRARRGLLRSLNSGNRTGLLSASRRSC